MGKFPSCAPKPGDRFPYMLYNYGGVPVNIQERVKGLGFHLFTFTKDKPFSEIQRVAEKYGHILTSETILFSSEVIQLFERLGIESCGCYLIRPDLYIAYRSVKPDSVHFESWLQRFLK